MTIFFPNQNTVANAKKISEQVDYLFLCDNSPVSNASVFMNMHNTRYIFNNSNLAISAAFNRVLKGNDVIWNNNDIIVFFDQDTCIEDGHINRLYEEYMRLNDMGLNIGAIGPVYYMKDSTDVTYPKREKQLSSNSFLVNQLITSSMMMKYGVLATVNYWNEQLFLDLSDFDLCWRLNKEGYICVNTDIVQMKHTVGVNRIRFGKKDMIVSSPLREYYQTKNRLYLIKQDYTPLNNKLVLFFGVTIRPILHLLLLDERTKRVKYIYKGIKDYFHGYMGEYGNNN